MSENRKVADLVGRLSDEDEIEKVAHEYADMEDLIEKLANNLSIWRSQIDSVHTMDMGWWEVEMERMLKFIEARNGKGAER